MTRKLLALALLTAATSVARADDIRLRHSVRLDSGAAVVRLADVATLDGDEAAALAETVLAPIPDDGRPLKLGIREIRARLQEAGAHLGRINLSGASVVVRPRRSGPSVLPALAVASVVHDEVAEAADTRAPEALALEATVLDEEPTLRGAVVRYLLHELDLRPDELRVRLDGAEADALALSSQRHRFELDPQSSLRSDSVRFKVRAWSEGMIVARHEVTIQPLVRCVTAQLQRDLRHNDVISRDDLVFRTEWLPAAQAAAAGHAEELVGRVATRLVHAGDTLHPGQVRKRTIIERGDRLTVRRRVGGIVISVVAEAREDGARGDVIEVRRPGERETFLATVVAANEAIQGSMPDLQEAYQ